MSQDSKQPIKTKRKKVRASIRRYKWFNARESNNTYKQLCLKKLRHCTPFMNLMNINEVCLSQFQSFDQMVGWFEWKLGRGIKCYWPACGNWVSSIGYIDDSKSGADRKSLSDMLNNRICMPIIDIIIQYNQPLTVKYCSLHNGVDYVKCMWKPGSTWFVATGYPG